MMSAMGYDKCLKCKRTMRPNGTRANEAPGTVSTGARGYCSSCYQGMRRAGILGRLHNYVPEHERASVEQSNSACVLVRIDVTPATYKTLRRAKVNIGAELARYADLMARQLEARNA